MATEETRARIMEAAGPIFADKGSRDATVREICDAAGVGLASVNYHFRDKQRLYVQVVEQAFDYVRENFSPPPELSPETPPDRRLRACIFRTVRDVLRKRDVPRTQDETWQQRLVAREIQDPTPSCEPLIRARLEQYLEPLFDVLSDVLPSTTPGCVRWRIAFSILGQSTFYDTHGPVVRLLVGAKADTPPYQTEQLAEHISQVCLAALGLTPSLAALEQGAH